jgi:deoxyribodipyrimidine photolyase
MHRRQTLQQLAQQDDLFLKESITTAEDERTAMAKADKTDPRQKTIDRAHEQSNTKPTASITQQARNTTYRIFTAFKRTATQLLTNKKQVTFGNTIEQANKVHLT